MFGFFSSRTSLHDTGLMKGFTDNHSHILYGVDDGVGTKEEALSILSLMEDEGVKTVWCTPHFMEDVPNKTSDIREKFETLKSEWAGSIELKLASENMLVETSTWAAPMDFWDMIDSILVAGIKPVVAHPERYRYMQMKDYKRLVDMGAELQLNLPSIIGVYGDNVSRKAEAILDKGWYSMVGTDCHRFRALESQLSCKILSQSTVAKLKSLMSR